MELHDFIVKSHNTKDDEDLFNLLKDFVQPLGFDSLIFCLMTDHASIGEPAKHGKITGYPEDWMKHYIAKDYETLDPIRKESMLMPQSIFTWDEVDKIRPYNKKERMFMNEADEAGLKCGVAVSLENPYKESVALGFASSKGGVELDPVMLSKLKLISIQFYDVYQNLKSSRIMQDTKPRVSLSEREREVLQWAAAGKSTPDIATILNISERTVNYFLQQCFSKLNANSKTLAVVKSIRLGLIKLDSDFQMVPVKTAA